MASAVATRYFRRAALISKWNFRTRRGTRLAEGLINGGRVNHIRGVPTWVNLRFEDRSATERTFHRVQRRVQAPAVYAFTMIHVFAGLQLSELLVSALDFAQADRTDP